MQGVVYNATGRRKSAVARVYLKAGNGEVVINGRKLEDYFPSPLLQYVVRQPFTVITEGNAFDVKVNLGGGGISGQAEAVRLGIARALVKYDEELKPILRAHGFVTRDSRRVERKKPGQPGARKRFQFSKR